MAFTPKVWVNSPDTGTPISAAALIDLEERVTDYSETVAASGIELGYAEITSNATSSSGSYADVAGLSTTVTVGARPVKIIFNCSSVTNGAAAGGVGVAILEDGVMVASTLSQAVDAGDIVPMYRERRRAPSAGNHTYKIQLKRGFGGTASINADSGTTHGPASILVVEI